VHAQRAGRADGGVLQISLLQINCSAPARKLESLKMRKEVKTFRNFPAEHINICKEPKKGEKSQRFSKSSLQNTSRKPKKKKIRPKFSKIFL